MRHCQIASKPGKREQAAKMGLIFFITF